MRLIDADALLNSGFPTIYHTEFGDEVVNTDDIRNAPTVELFCSYLSDGEVRQPCVEAPCKHERPTGEWIKETMGYYCYFKCNNCNSYNSSVKTKYCPNCGAKMKGAEK